MTLAEWIRRAWRIPVWLRYRLLQRHRLKSTRLQRVGRWNLVLTPQVFDPGIFRSGRFLAEVMERVNLEPDTEVLDLGTGSGILALAAASRGCGVTAVDINPAAIRCAMANARLNRLDDRIDVLLGDLFGPVKERRFDLVLFNPPYLRGEPRHLEERAFRDPEMPHRFARELRDHLQPAGKALLVLSSIGREHEFLKALRSGGWRCTPIAERDLWSEVLRVFRVEGRQHT